MSTLKEGQVLITKARLGYPKLWAASGIKGDPTSKPRYGAALYIPKEDVKTKASIDKEIERLSKVHFKGVRPKSKDLCIKDGDGEDGDENTVGHWIVSANRNLEQGRPQVIDRDRSPLTADDGKPYAGCYVNALISVYVPKNWGKICASLEVVQFAKDGEPFGAGRVNVDDVMPDLVDEDEDFEA